MSTPSPVQFIIDGPEAAQRDLEQRLTAVLENEQASSNELSALAAEVEDAAAAADQAAKAAHAEARCLPCPDPVGVLQQAQAAELTRDRLDACLPRLRDKLRAAIAQEYRERWQADFRRTEALRNAAAANFARYPELVAEMIALFREAEQVDQEIARVNNSAYDNQRLVGVEQHARGLQQFSRNTPSLRKAVVDWQSGKQIWPPRRAIDPSLFAPVPYNQAYSQNWAATAELKAAERRAEADRVAEYYQRQDRERKEREQGRHT